MWDGAYAGISRGPTSFSATTSSVNHNVNTSTRTFPAGAVTVTNTINDTVTNSSGSNWGSQADISLGYNFRLGGNVVASLQVEGTIASSQATLNASQVSVANATAGTTTTSTITTATFLDNVAERWRCRHWAALAG